jgi:UDP-2,3-diacylglucosamine pyrophosphatase LpxH
MQPVTYRTIWLSDIHLGLKASRTEYLYDFLQHTESEYLYLVGDIIDLWKAKRGWHWPEINNKIVRLIMDKARRGTRVVYVPGNHDEFFRDYIDLYFAGIHITPRAEHVTEDGTRLLILHGDEFDAVTLNNKWVAKLGSEAYDMLIVLNHWFNWARRKLGFGYWSLSKHIKHKVKEAVSYIGNFEEAVVHAARQHGADGVVCGHIHHAIITDYEEIRYANCGDWVESCTALAEEDDGSLRLIHWVEESAELIDARQTYENRNRDRRVVAAN